MRNQLGSLARTSCGASLRAAMLLFALASCGSPAGTTIAVPHAYEARVPGAGSSSSPIQHVVIIIQENRTFENLFAGFPGADAPLFGDYHGTKVPLRVVHFAPIVNLDHFFRPAVAAWDDGKMDNFSGSVSGLPTLYPYAHLSRHEVAPYWTMAKQYVLADRMFPTQFGPSFTGHLTLIAGTADLTPTKSEANNPIGGPWGCDASPGTFTYTVNTKRKIGVGPFPCFTQFNTMAQTLDAAGVSWKYYAPPIYSDKGGDLWSSFDSIRAVRYSPDWQTNVVPQVNVLTDAKRGTLPAVSWVIPDWDWSDHASTGSDLGPSWVSAVVNAIGEGPDWKSTAIVVVWDDWGGWYDNVPPPQLDFRGLGIRVGCLIVSPYVHPHVSHTQYEFGSILKFVEQNFGLAPLGSTADGYTDTRATSIADSFDFTMLPRAFVPIKSKYPPSTFLKWKPSMRPPDTDL